MKVHETRSHGHPAGEQDDKVIMTRKQKAENKTHEAEQSPKKPKPENGDNKDSHANGKSAVAAEFEEFSTNVKDQLTLDQMKEILKLNDQVSDASDTAIILTCLDVLFFGPLAKCPVCKGNLEFNGSNYSCTGSYSEWASCTYKTRVAPRMEDQLKLPDFALNSSVSDLLKNHQDPSRRPKRELAPPEKPFMGMMISLSGRLTRTHGDWKKEIEKHGGKVANSVAGVTCLVVSHMERHRGGSSKVTEAIEKNVPVLRESWLSDSIKKQEVQPMDAYDCISDLTTYGKGIPWDKQDPGEEALESLSAEVKLYGKRGIYKDTMLQQQGGNIFERDGIIYNCAFSLCDLGKGLNEFAITELITVPEKNLHLYYKRGRVGDDARAEERLEEFENVDTAIAEFARLFEELTGNKFEPWEREKKIQKKPRKFFPVDTDEGYDVRYGGLGIRQLGIAVTHCKLDPMIANFMKVFCSQEIYRYSMMEMGLDSPDLPMGMLTDLHLKRCEETLHQFVDALKTKQESGEEAEALWSEFSQRWFTLMHSTRPFIFRDFQELADHAASGLETVRDIVAASHIIGDLTGSTLDDPLSDRYGKLGCSIEALDKESDDYKMILKYVDKTYEPYKVGDVSYGMSVENVYVVESSACPSLDEMKKLPNKVLLWCGTRSSNLVRHLQKGFLPAICSLPVPGYMFGKAIVCSDAAAEAAKYGFTAVDRPEGFLVLAVVSLGDEINEVTSPPKDTESLEKKKTGVKGLGRKKTDESEHFVWRDDIKVPCGRLIPSEHKDSVLEYNEYAVYDPKQTCIRFLVGVKYEEIGVEYDTA
ncbi:hypothetical protein V2J09_020982 [Rumex salicifolius]